MQKYTVYIPLRKCHLSKYLKGEGMAKKRMFSLGVLDTDAFMDMPLSAQALYFHLNLRADDDGFIGNPKRIVKVIGASDDDLKLLVAKRFVLAFEDGVIVIKHWRMHNAIRKDRYTQTNFYDDLLSLKMKPNGSYTLNDSYPGIGVPEGISMEDESILEDNDCVPEEFVEDTEEEKKNLKAQHKKDVDEFFEKVWQLYIRKEGKNAVSKRAKEEIFTLGFDAMEKAIQNYAKQKEGSEKQYILMGSTFFNGRYKDYLVEEPAVSEVQNNIGQLQRTLQ